MTLPIPVLQSTSVPRGRWTAFLWGGLGLFFAVVSFLEAVKLL